MKRLFFFVLLLLSTVAQAQTYDTAGALVIEPGVEFIIDVTGTVSVQKDVILQRNISGVGRLYFEGTTPQTIFCMGDFTVPTLRINNAAGVDLAAVSGTGTLTVLTALELHNGKLSIGNKNIILADGATTSVNTSSGNVTSFVQTSGSGQLIRKLSGPVTNLEFPVGDGASYHPAYLTIPSGTFTNAQVGVRTQNVPSGNRPRQIASYLKAIWPVTMSGVGGSAVPKLTGTYLPSDVQGNETDLAGYVFNGTNWSSFDESHDAAANTITAIVGNGLTLTGMNKFVAVGARAFLQGAYESTTGLMRDNLRSPDGTTVNNLIPLTDPYRSIAGFSHVNNPNTELVSSSVFNTKATDGDNVVDWVFLELRKPYTTGANNIVATRSALLLRDGDIVDLDGSSPVTFNNAANGNYGLTIRHRNHLPLSLDPINPQMFTETQSTAFTTRLFDSRTAAANKIYGDANAYTTASHPTLGTVNLMWGGNANSNGNVRYTGPSNDLGTILSSLNGNYLGSIGNVYHAADLNLDRTLKYSGPNSDASFLLSKPLQSNSLKVITQQIPN